MVIKACAMALKNIRKSILHGERIQYINHHVNIGVAVAVEDGVSFLYYGFTDAMSYLKLEET
jgi:beta-glucosidase/6-phospho-beta-glucosidase/beta-galactosidase